MKPRKPIKVTWQNGTCSIFKDTYEASEKLNTSRARLSLIINGKSQGPFGCTIKYINKEEYEENRRTEE